jgi:hypothetical protein
MLVLLARQSILEKECWQRWNEYAAASKKDKPAIENEINALAGEIEKLEAEILNNGSATH